MHTLTAVERTGTITYSYSHIVLDAAVWNSNGYEIAETVIETPSASQMGK